MKFFKQTVLFFLITLALPSLVSGKSSSYVPSSFQVRTEVITDKDREIRILTEAHLKKNMAPLIVKANGKVIYTSKYKDYNPKNGTMYFKIPKQKGGTILDFSFAENGLHIQKKVLGIKSFAREKYSKKVKMPSISVGESLPMCLFVTPSQKVTIKVYDGEGKLLYSKKLKKGMPFEYRPLVEETIFVYFVKNGKRTKVLKF